MLNSRKKQIKNWLVYIQQDKKQKYLKRKKQSSVELCFYLLLKNKTILAFYPILSESAHSLFGNRHKKRLALFGQGKC